LYLGFPRLFSATALPSPSEEAAMLVQAWPEERHLSATLAD
jgi:hypothetical protein